MGQSGNALERARIVSRQVIEEIRSSGFLAIAERLEFCPACELTCPGISRCPRDPVSISQSFVGEFAQYPIRERTAKVRRY
jgi:hypothetical protein